MRKLLLRKRGGGGGYEIFEKIKKKTLVSVDSTNHRIIGNFKKYFCINKLIISKSSDPVIKLSKFHGEKDVTSN